MENNKNFCDKITKLCLDHFNALPKSGKPNSTEWTILSCIILEQDGVFSVVALGTGSKCIGQDKMSKFGDTLNDSHAEVICRRSFIRFLYTEMMDNNSSLLIFNENSKTFNIRCDVKFHFFTTHMPCGDCAIFSKQSCDEFGVALESVEEGEVIPFKKARLDADIFRTGAKCLTFETQDSRLPGKDYHVLGKVRTKPGRGDPTLSVSCSDKITKWCYLGLQGALLSILLNKPVYISSITMVGGTPYSIESFNRALYARIGEVDLIAPYVCKQILIKQSNLSFEFSKTDNKKPCPSSISWCKIKSRSLEVAVEGKRQGVIKKKLNTEIGRLKICKLELFKCFIEICRLKHINLSNDFAILEYGNAKALAEIYQQNWAILKKKFGMWTKKNPELLNFTVKNS